MRLFPHRTLQSDVSPVAGLTRLQRQLAFSKPVRAEAWQLLADVLGSGEDLGRMMEAVAEGYRLQGQKAVAGVLMELREGLGGAGLSARLVPYTGTAERILFEGLGRQDAGALLGGAARILRMEMALRKAILGAVALPILLLAGLLGLVLFFGYQLLPALAEVIEFERLPRFQKTVVDLTLAISANPAALAISLGGAVLGTALAMRYWTGPGRAQADRIPPFSLMRLQAGAGFLFAVVEYGRSGQAVTTRLLDRMAAAAPPYARSRIAALSDRFTAAGNNLGSAALMAGHGFPAVGLSAVLSVLWNQDNGIERVGAFLERWLTRIEDNVRARMALMNAALMALITAALLALMSIALPIFEQINSGGNF